MASKRGPYSQKKEWVDEKKARGRLKIDETDVWKNGGKECWLPENRTDPSKTSAAANTRIHVACLECGTRMRRTPNTWTKGGVLCPECRKKQIEFEKEEAHKRALERQARKHSLWNDYPWQVIRQWDWGRNEKGPWDIRPDSPEGIHLVCPDCGERYEWTARKWRASIEGKWKGELSCPRCHPNAIRRAGFQIQPSLVDTDFWKEHSHLYVADGTNPDPRTLGILSAQRIAVICPFCGNTKTVPVRSWLKYSYIACSCRQGLFESPEDATVAKAMPSIAAEWDYEKNGDTTPDDVTYGSPAMRWWRCKNPKCGCSYQESPKNRYHGCGCPSCSKQHSRAAQYAGEALKELGFDVEGEWTHPTCRRVNVLRFDWGAFKKGEGENRWPLFLLEYQGAQHVRNVPGWGGKEAFAYRTENDAIKRAWCEENGVPLLEIPHSVTTYEEVKSFIHEFVAETLLTAAL